MGGRGASSSYVIHTAAGIVPPEGYTIESNQDGLKPFIHPFLNETNRAWRLVRRPVSTPEAHLDRAYTFGHAEPTLRWVKDGAVTDLYVEGMDTAAFLAHSGLQLSLEKGGYVLSKRLSRVMRPQFASGFFDKQDVQIGYMTQSERDAKIWDGAGLIDRRMVERVLAQSPLPNEKKRKVRRDLRKSNRLEFTVLTENGEDKGHCLVVDNLRDAAGNHVDFLLPEDTKQVVKQVDGRVFVGLAAVHGKQQMRLDIQSIVNHHAFFEREQVMGWLKDEHQLFVQGIENGNVNAVMRRVAGVMTEEELARWPVHEYLASGGDPRSFRGVIRSLLNEELKRLNHQKMDKVRMSIPGMRQYVLPAAVGNAAGKAINVKRGEIKIDPDNDTVWVNDDDWIDLGSGAGIADILGGADNDDAMWLFGFTDVVDGEQKVMMWRSPNQRGEYVILRPTADSTAPEWEKADGTITTYPDSDPRKLATRIDLLDPTYRGRLNVDQVGNLATDAPYSIDEMSGAIDRATVNEGIVGQYCNALVVHQALFNRLPDDLPAPLEDVIDATMKTGADARLIRRWCYEHTARILRGRVPIPRILEKRLNRDWSQSKETRPPAPRYTTDHWLDLLQNDIQTHIKTVTADRERLMNEATIPDPLLDDLKPHHLELGRELNRVFSAALKQGTAGAKPDQPITLLDLLRGETAVLQNDSKLDVARRKAEDLLAQFKPSEQIEIVRGAMVSLYVREDGKRPSDTILWLAGQNLGDGGRERGIGNVMISMLRKYGVIDYVETTQDGLFFWNRGMFEDENSHHTVSDT